MKQMIRRIAVEPAIAVALTEVFYGKLALTSEH